MTRRMTFPVRKPLLVAAAASLMALAPGLALAQANYGPGRQQQTSGEAEVAQAGANTTAGTTNGDSGPKKPGSGATEASADLCQNYHGKAHEFCLAVETDKAPANEQPSAGGQPAGNSGGQQQ